jgi:hypothetical protein
MKKAVLAFVTIILFIMVVVGFYFLGKSRSNQSRNFNIPNSFVEVTPATTLVPSGPMVSPTQTPMQRIRGGGILSFPKYELSAGSDWNVSRESDSPDVEKISLTKDGYTFSILEGGFGGSACLYPGDADIEGPSARYEYYVEINGKSGDLFRRSWSDTGGFGICQKTQYGWEAPTLFGSIAFITPSPTSSEIISEMDSILASITRI